MGYFIFSILLLPAVLTISVFKSRYFEFKEAFIVAVVNVLVVMGWVAFWEASYEYGNYTIADLIAILNWFPYIGPIGLISGWFMYWGANQWKHSHIASVFICTFGCGVLLIPALLYLYMKALYEAG